MAIEQSSEASNRRSVHTTCYMCACRCGIEVTVENEQIRFIKGIKANPVNKGVWCAKGGAGIMTEYSPGRLTTPLMRRPGAERGQGDMVPVDWDTALATVEGWLRDIRQVDPAKLAIFTGRDQMQTFTGYFARQYGTPNWAAHGGFCSVNMAAAGMYSVGGSFWEFGWPDLDQASWFMMFGVAEDHPSNPLKLAISALKDRGGRFIVVNPVKSGYGALADEWVPIRPGTDGALIMAMMHVLDREGLVDEAYLKAYTNAPGLIIRHPGHADDGLRAGDDERDWLVARRDGSLVAMADANGEGVLEGEYKWQGQVVEPAYAVFRRRLAEMTPRVAEATTGIAARTIVRLALEMGTTAMHHPIVLPIAWTDRYGREHAETIGRPVAFHAMRGLAAHSNGFQTIRALFDMMMMLGTIDVPGGFRYKSPYPKPVPPPVKPAPNRNDYQPGMAAKAPLLGYPTTPDDMLVDGDEPLRIDEAYSWKYPLAAHGVIQNVIRNAYDQTPYPIDTLMVYMANLAWNSTWNTLDTRSMLTAKNDDGEYRIPHVVVFDAYDSETVAFADIVLPDTTYLERWDAASLQDRPISEVDGPADSIRQPVVAPPPGVRPTADVLIDLANRLALPGFVEAGTVQYRNYHDFIQLWQTRPGSGVGLLAGHRGRDGQDILVGEPNAKQLDAYADQQAFWFHRLDPGQQYYRMANQAYLQWAHASKFLDAPDPIVLHFYSEVLQTFRLAGQGLWPGKKPINPGLRKRLATYFDPLPEWYPPFEDSLEDNAGFPFRIITQRPMTHYHSWGSQNAWLRQLLNENPVFMNPKAAKDLGLGDGEWVWIESRLGKMTGVLRYSDAVEPSTVWTWNAVAKQRGSWGLDPSAPEANRAILINHIIPDTLPTEDGMGTLFNNDPITGQASWYDTRVRIYSSELHEVWPTVPARKPKDPERAKTRWLKYDASVPQGTERKRR